MVDGGYPRVFVEARGGLEGGDVYWQGGAKRVREGGVTGGHSVGLRKGQGQVRVGGWWSGVTTTAAGKKVSRWRGEDREGDAKRHTSQSSRGSSCWAPRFASRTWR